MVRYPGFVKTMPGTAFCLNTLSAIAIGGGWITMSGFYKILLPNPFVLSEITQ